MPDEPQPEKSVKLGPNGEILSEKFERPPIVQANAVGTKFRDDQRREHNRNPKNYFHGRQQVIIKPLDDL